MKITKTQLKQIIKEELGKVIREDEEELEAIMGEEDELEDEWFPPGLEEAVGIGTIALGTALGILGAYGGVTLGRKTWKLFKTIDRKLGKALARKARENARQVRGEAREEIRDLLANDYQLEELVNEYHRLVLEVERIKGKRGPEYKAIRADRKEAGEKLRKHVEELLQNIPDLVSPHLRGPARKVVLDPETTRLERRKR